MRIKNKTCKIFMYFLIISIFSQLIIGFNITYHSPEKFVNSDDVKLIIEASDISDCKYDMIDTDYQSMSNYLETNSTTHQTTLTNLSDKKYTYYVNCINNTNVTLDDNLKIEFTVDTKIPNINSKKPIENIKNDVVWMEILLDEDAICKYDKTNTTYDNMQYKFSESNDSENRERLSKLHQDEHIYYIGCSDPADNIIYDKINFSVTLPPTFEIDHYLYFKEGTHKITVSSSKYLISKPTLSYKFDSESTLYDVSLIQTGNKKWEGYIIIPEDHKSKVARFIIEGEDEDGLKGNKINNGEIFMIDTEKPIKIEDIKITLNNESNNPFIEINWFYQEDNIYEYNIYRSKNKEVTYNDLYEDTKKNYFEDEDFQSNSTYYYKIAAVDNSKNIGELSDLIMIETKKESSKKEKIYSYEFNESINNFLSKTQVMVEKIKKINKELEATIDQNTKFILKKKNIIEKNKDILNNIIKFYDTISDDRKQKIESDKLSKKIIDFESKIEDYKKEIIKKIIIKDFNELEKQNNPTEFENILNKIIGDIDLEKNEYNEFIIKSTMLNNNLDIKKRIYSYEKISYSNKIIKKTLFIDSLRLKNNTKKTIIVKSIPDMLFENIKGLDVQKDFRKIDKNLYAKNMLNFKEINYTYTIDDILEDKSFKNTRYYLIYSVDNFIKIKNMSNKDSNMLTGSSVFDNLPKINIKNIDLKDIKNIAIPLLGIIIISSLLIYYFFFLKDESIQPGFNTNIHHEINNKNNFENLSEKQDIDLSIKDKRLDESKLSKIDNRCIDKENLQFNKEIEKEMDNFNKLQSLIRHTKNHVDELNVKTAIKEYRIIRNLYQNIRFENDYTRLKIKNNILNLYKKISMLKDIDNVLNNNENMDIKELKKISNNMGILISSLKEESKFSRFVIDYYKYINNLIVLKENSI